jgi:hypothetical protein
LLFYICVLFDRTAKLKQAIWGDNPMWLPITFDRSKSSPPSPRAHRRVFQIALAAATAVCLAIAPGARADAIVQFSLKNIIFTDGTFATGNFTIDETTGVITQWMIQYTDNVSGLVPSLLLTTANSAAQDYHMGPPDYLTFGNLSGGIAIVPEFS